MKYTVLLLYPDYMSDGTETYLAHVEAPDATNSVVKAQVQATRANGLSVRKGPDFAPLFVCAGHQEDVTP